MAISYSDVRTVEGALETGILRSTYWVMHKLRDPFDRRMFLRSRFPNIPHQSLMAVLGRLERAYEQGLAVRATGQLPTLGRLQFDPTHQYEGRIAYNVEITIRGWEGPRQAGRPPNLATRYHTIYAEENMTVEQLEEEMQRFVDEVTSQDHYNPATTPDMNVHSWGWQLISATRSF